jgi:hypothetical protein
VFEYKPGGNGKKQVSVKPLPPELLAEAGD